MSLPTGILPLARSRAVARCNDYLSLGKPRIVLFILFSAGTGFLLAAPGAADPARLLLTLLGTAGAAAGSMALNQFLERDLDARMERTLRRPLPAGRLQPREALLLGSLLAAAGVVHLAVFVNAASAFWAAFTAAWYLAVYTPLKRRSPYGFLVGAVCGATPPLIGWSAAVGRVDVGAWILFGIVFLWQVPHTLAIARLYREDYARAGVPVLPVVEPDGASTRRQVVASSLALLSVGLLPTMVGMAGPLYFLAALLLGGALLGFGVGLGRPAAAGERRLLLATLVYLPLLFGVMLLDAPGLTLW